MDRHEVIGKRRIWELGVVLKRWGILLWICPFGSVVFGLVMVWAFFHANVTVDREFYSQQLTQHEPRGHEEYILSRLRSEEAAREVGKAMKRDYGSSWLPLWWIQESVEIKPSHRKWLDHSMVYVVISTRHPSDRVANGLCESYLKIAEVYNNERYQKHMEQWLAERSALIKTIQEAGGDAATLQAQLASVENDKESLKKWLFLMNGGSHVSSGSRVKTHGIPRRAGPAVLPSWWNDMSLWWRYLIECAAWGLLSGPVLMYFFEALFPRRISNGSPA